MIKPISMAFGAALWAVSSVMLPNFSWAEEAEEAVEAPEEEKQAYFTELDDVPVMKGLVEQADQSLIFDKPWGRIVQVVATGPVDQDRVLMFYWQTLPSLGWERRMSGKFERETETMLIDIQPMAEGQTKLRI